MEVAQVELDGTKRITLRKKVHLYVRCFQFREALNRPELPLLIYVPCIACDVICFTGKDNYDI